jgi:hypothetical protein
MRKVLALIGGCLLLTFAMGLQAEEVPAYEQTDEECWCHLR